MTDRRAKEQIRFREQLCQTGLAELQELYRSCDSHDIYYLKQNKYETISDPENGFLDSITKITDYQPGSDIDGSQTTWYGETTFVYGRAMYFKAVYDVQHQIDYMDCWITITVSGDPAKVGGVSHF